MKLLTFTWSWTVSVPDDFDTTKDLHKARDEAWLNVNKSDGELTDEQDEPEDRPQPDNETGQEILAILKDRRDHLTDGLQAGDFRHVDPKLIARIKP